MAFLRPNHIAILSDRVHIPLTMDRAELVRELLDRLDELDAPAAIDSPATFNEACAVSAALRHIEECWWNRRSDQRIERRHITERRDAIDRLASPYARKHLIRAADDRHAAAFLLASAMRRSEAATWTTLRRLNAIGALRRGRFEHESWDRAFVVGYSAPIRSTHSTSDDEGRNWPRFFSPPDLLALPTFAHVPDEIIATLPVLDEHHTVVSLGTSVGEARHPSISRFTQAAVHRLQQAYPMTASNQALAA